MICIVKLHPGSSQERIETREEHVEIWLSARAIDGAANAALCKLLKRHFAAKAVHIKSGLTSRMKRVEVLV